MACAAAALLTAASAHADDPKPPPKEVEYQTGDAVPEGMVIATRTRYDLMLIGASVFTAGYIAPFVAGAVCKGQRPEKQCRSGWEIVPLVGPLVDMAVTDKMPGGSKAVDIVGSLGQIGGATVFVAALVLEKKVLVPAGTPVSFAPVVTPTYAGVMVTGAAF
jgi:hypothetical protein